MIYFSFSRVDKNIQKELSFIRVGVTCDCSNEGLTLETSVIH